MSLDNLLGNIETQSGTATRRFPFSPVKSFEEVLHRLLADACAMVDNLE